MAVESLPNLVYLTNIPAPYRIVMMESWALHLAADMGVGLRACYTDRGDQGRGWTTRGAAGVEEKRLATLFSVPGYGRLNRGLFDMVRRNDIVMIGGFEQVSYLAAALLARAMGRKVILLFDGFNPRRIGRDKAPVRFVKWLTARLCHGFFANGQVGRDVLTRIGVDESRIFNQYLSVSTRDIESQRARSPDKAALRAELHLPADRRIAAFCGYLLPGKRPELILEAVAALEADARPVVLFIGRGPLKESLRHQAEALGVEAVFAGFREGADLARHYLAADFLVLPSDNDSWGLVINEAMAAGLPVIASDACGATPDLVLDGVTGYGFRAGDAGDLRRAVADMLAADIAVMGEAARARIGQWTPEHSARSLCACLRTVLAK